MRLHQVPIPVGPWSRVKAVSLQSLNLASTRFNLESKSRRPYKADFRSERNHVAAPQLSQNPFGHNLIAEGQKMAIVGIKRFHVALEHRVADVGDADALLLMRG